MEKPNYKQMKEDYEAKHRKSVDEALSKAGFDLSKLTQAQKDIIMEPNEAPENFYQDGEVDHKEAARGWVRRMRDAGMGHDDIKRAAKFIFG